MKKPAVTLIEMVVVLIIIAGVSFFNYYIQPKNFKNEQIRFWQTLDLEIRNAQTQAKINNYINTINFTRRQMIITDNKTYEKIIKYPATIQLENPQPVTLLFSKQNTNLEVVTFSVMENGRKKEYQLNFGLEWGAYKFEPIPAGLYHD